MSKYDKEIKPGVTVDVYDVLQAWGVSNPALSHLIKKALQPGARGHKDLETDLTDIIMSALRAYELETGKKFELPSPVNPLQNMKNAGI